MLAVFTGTFIDFCPGTDNPSASAILSRTRLYVNTTYKPVITITADQPFVYFPVLNFPPLRLM